MDINITNNDLIVTGLTDFSLDHIFDCGQCFRFNRCSDGSYFGVAKGRALRISQSESSVIFHETSKEDFLNIWFDYFDLGRDYGAIKAALSKDSVMREAVSYGDGIRILNQELWETVVSFIISASNNIPRIKGIIERLCESFGEKISYMGSTYFAFPDAKTLASLTREDLSVIRAGFRDKYIIDAAKKFSRGELCEDIIKALPTPDAKKALMSISGVGNKVSDCILLFGLARADSFPVDVWIKRITEYCYFGGEKRSIDEIAAFADKRFGPLGGFAQQYLFFYARENKIGIDKTK